MSLSRISAPRARRSRPASSPASRHAGIDDAATTLGRATAFLGSASWIMAGEHGPRATGNSLRELDRFLSLLLNALAEEDLARQHNCANKMGCVLAAMGVEADYAHHLRSVGRVRNCLAYTNGTVRRGDTRRAPLLTMSWLRAAGVRGPLVRIREVRIGESLGLTPRDLAEICWFYDFMARDLLGRVAA